MIPQVHAVPMIKPLSLYNLRYQTFKIYTKTGDKGTSALYTGDRLAKDNKIFACLGDIDEINASIGLARQHCVGIKDLNESVLQQITEIQARLIDLGSHVATPR